MEKIEKRLADWGRIDSDAAFSPNVEPVRFGGFKIVRTMGMKLTRLGPMQGFCAETGGGIFSHAVEVRQVATEVHTGFSQARLQLGGWGIFLLFLTAYSRGSGTYTGLDDFVCHGQPDRALPCDTAHVSQTFPERHLRFRRRESIGDQITAL